jgi:hypothetical protein
MNTIINITAFVILSALWLGFGAALIFQNEALNRCWRAFRRLPIVLQFTLAFLTLPLVLGLWVWQTRWPVWLRIITVSGLA